MSFIRRNIEETLGISLFKCFSAFFKKPGHIIFYDPFESLSKLLCLFVHSGTKMRIVYEHTCCET